MLLLLAPSAVEGAGAYRGRGGVGSSWLAQEGCFSTKPSQASCSTKASTLAPHTGKSSLQLKRPPTPLLLLALLLALLLVPLLLLPAQPSHARPRMHTPSLRSAAAVASVFEWPMSTNSTIRPSLGNAPHPWLPLLAPPPPPPLARWPLAASFSTSSVRRSNP